MQSDPKKKFDIREYEVFDSDPFESGTGDHPQRYLLKKDAPMPEKKVKKKSYAWAFFLASLFMGLGTSFIFGEPEGPPVGLFMGMSVGFLFFVEPIYEKVMKMFD